MSHRAGRRGMTLIEVLVVIGVVALLIGLLLPAIQGVRAAAVKLKSANKLRQIVIATHNYAAANNDELPGYGIIVPGVPGYGTVPVVGRGTFFPVLPYLEGDTTVVRVSSYPDDPLAQGSYVPAYQSPADPSLFNPARAGDISYIANHQVLRAKARLDSSCPDGTANTITFAERYARCRDTASLWDRSIMSCTDGSGGYVICSEATFIFERRPTFADPEYDDVLPVTAGGVTRPSVAGRTFQVAPTIEACDYRVPQTPHAGGMLTAYLDGSVRTTRPGVAPEVFWAAVTPNGGETVGD